MAERATKEIVYRDGHPVAVIPDIDEYRELLERLEDLDDLAMLDEMRAQGLSTGPLEGFLEEYSPGV